MHDLYYTCTDVRSSQVCNAALQICAHIFLQCIFFPDNSVYGNQLVTGIKMEALSRIKHLLLCALRCSPLLQPGDMITWYILFRFMALCYTQNKNMNPGGRLLESQFQLCVLSSYLTSMCLNFPVSEMEIKSMPTSQVCTEK